MLVLSTPRLLCAAFSNAGSEPSARVRLAFWRVTQREPTRKEIDRGLRIIARLQRERMSREQALVRFCTVAPNLNEFLYLD